MAYASCNRIKEVTIGIDISVQWNNNEMQLKLLQNDQAFPKYDNSVIELCNSIYVYFLEVIIHKLNIK